MKRICLLFFILSSLGTYSQVGINSDNSAPDASAGLDISFGDKGFLIPRMTTAERDLISNPAKGLQIFNTDCDEINFNAGTPSSPVWASLISTQSPQAGVSITSNPVGALCGGTPVTYTATTINGGSSPTYQWKANGTDIPGETNQTYYNASPVNGTQITCVIYSNEPCVTGSPATSNSIIEVVSPSVPASVSITVNPTGAVCEGTSLTFTAEAINGGIPPAYQWQKNGSNILGGTNSTYTTSTLSDGDEITCIMTSSATCVTGSPATSNSIVQNVNPILPASVSIAAVPSGPICAGTSVTLTATPVNGGTSPAYQWKKNGTDIPGADNAVYVTTGLVDGDEISCVMTSSEECVSGSPATSAGEIFTVYAIPSSAFTPASGTQNASITFTPATSGADYSWSFTSGSISSSTAENPVVSWSSLGTWSVSLTVTQNGCSSTTNGSIAINPPTVQTFNATGTGKNGSIQTFVVPANGTYTIETWGAGSVKAAWNVSNGFSSVTAGLGARMRGDFNLTAGTTLNIVVGQAGTSGSQSSSGGGGTFVYTGTNSMLIVAGGGGGCGLRANGAGGNGVTTTSGTSQSGNTTAGTGGLGGGSSSTNYSGAGGAGYNGNGANSTSQYPGYGGQTYSGSWVGGSASDSAGFGSDGGFGGGGAAGAEGGGGGGGYSGGSGGYGCVNCFSGGGGGGSYNGGTNQSNAAGVWTGHGKVTITY